jgi:hypothetical protein
VINECLVGDLLLMPNFEGEIYMAHDFKELEDLQIRFLEFNSLGEGNRGQFGPVSKREYEAVRDCTKNKYIGPDSLDSHCMDDGFEGRTCQLPGNRAITEIAGEYMDSSIEAKPLSQALAAKVEELVSKNEMPWFHGDEKHGKSGCAALKLLCSGDTLRYNHEHKDVIASLTYTRLRLNGIDSIEFADILTAIETGAERAADKSLWDIGAEEAFDIAASHGAETEILNRKHRVAGSREDVSPYTFNNGQFRMEHESEDSLPLGMLSITYGAYINQLRQTGFSEEEVAKKTIEACLFTVGVLKLASTHELPAAIVGH